jgi:hypothetical protein
MKIKFIAIVLLSLIFTGCISTKSTIKNVETTVPDPSLSKSNTFIITEFSKDKKYGYDKDYPINVFYRNATNETINQQRFLNALTGPNGEKLSYSKKESCCPFPSKNNAMGAGMLDVYEVTWEGLATPILLYFNIYEKGLLMVPDGFGIKK